MCLIQKKTQLKSAKIRANSHKKTLFQKFDLCNRHTSLRHLGQNHRLIDLVKTDFPNLCICNFAIIQIEMLFGKLFFLLNQLTEDSALDIALLFFILEPSGSPTTS